MAFDAFLKLDGIKGESADHKHKGEIDIMSFSWGMTQTGTHAAGGGGGAGKVHVHDFHIKKKTDSASPLLMLHCANGQHVREAAFYVRKAGGEQLEYLKIKLTDVLVSSYKPQASISGNMGDGSVRTADGSVVPAVQLPGGDEIPVEEVSLNFAKIEFDYQAQGADGKAQGGAITAGWNVKTNQKV